MTILAKVIILFYSYSKVCAIVDVVFDPWTPRSMNRDDLRCPLKLCTPDDVKESWKLHSCCVCMAMPLWDLDGSFSLLSVEYKTRTGFANIVGNSKGHLKLIHNYGFLKKLPRNLCNFTNIVEIKLTHNNIEKIDELQCLYKLDSLDLSYNLIKYISRDTLKGLRNLRILRISHNVLTSVEANSLTGSNSIFRIDLSFNKMKKIEFSNAIPEHDFCIYDFSFNEIKEAVNTDGFTINTTKTYYGGMVNFDSNLFTRFIDFKKLGLEDVRILGRILEFGFSFMNVSWICDCEIEPYLEIFEDGLNRIWRDYFNWTCGNPSEFRGHSIPEYFVIGNRLDQMICNISYYEKCPRGCTCFHQPRYRRTVVNCTNAGLDQNLPSRMPENVNLTIILKGNTIKFLDYREYFNRTFSLDLSDNGLQEIKYGAFSRPIGLNLSRNNITGLPRDFQMFNPCSLVLGTVHFQCECSDLWIRDWTVNYKANECPNTTDIYCITPTKQIISSLLLQKEDLCLQDVDNLDIFNILFATLLALLLGVSGICFTFRYELYILRRKYMHRSLSKILPLFRYDVFVSFDENNDAIRMWVIYNLRLILKKYGYKCYIPCIDDVIGDIREEGLASSINVCKHYITIVSESYITEEENWTNIQWKYIWSSFKQNFERKIIVINFDHVDSSQIIDAKLKAFLRLGQDIDFSNRNHDLYKNIRKQLGDPVCKKIPLQNARSLFDKRKLNNFMYYRDFFQTSPPYLLKDKVTRISVT